MTDDFAILRSTNPDLVRRIVDGYREMAAHSRLLHAESRSPRHLSEAEYAEGRAALLEFEADPMGRVPCSS